MTENIPAVATTASRRLGNMACVKNGRIQSVEQAKSARAFCLLSGEATGRCANADLNSWRRQMLFDPGYADMSERACHEGQVSCEVRWSHGPWPCRDKCPDFLFTYVRCFLDLGSFHHSHTLLPCPTQHVSFYCRQTFVIGGLPCRPWVRMYWRRSSAVAAQFTTVAQQ